MTKAKHTCFNCGGLGTLMAYSAGHSSKVSCPVCHGTGKVPNFVKTAVETVAGDRGWQFRLQRDVNGRTLPCSIVSNTGAVIVQFPKVKHPEQRRLTGTILEQAPLMLSACLQLIKSLGNWNECPFCDAFGDDEDPHSDSCPLGMAQTAVTRIQRSVKQ